MKLLSVKPISILLISCLGLIVYSNTFFGSFHLDDFQLIVENSQIKNIHHFQNIWNYLPCRFLLYLSFALDYQWYQLRVLGYHVENLIIHLVSALLVWWLVLLTFSTAAMKIPDNKITADSGLIALFAGLVFVVHPIQTEAVTYIAQRAASLVTLFYLVSLCLYAKSRLVSSSGRASLFYFLSSLVMAIMAMFTKEIAITLPLTILLYEISFLKVGKGLNWKYITPFLLTIFVIPLAMLFFSSTKAINFQEMNHAIKGSSEISSSHYVLTQLRVLVTYIRLCFFPFHQNVDYDYPIFRNIFEVPVLLSLMFLMGILFWAKHLFLKYRILSFSIFWFFLTLLPESSLFPIKDVIFEHRLYLPMPGYSIFLVAGLYYLFGKNTIRSMVIMLIAIIVGYAALTYQRNKVWNNEFTLWDDAVQKSPHKERPYINRAKAYYDQGNVDRAMADYNRAIELNTDDELAYTDRGFLYTQQGNSAKAMSDFDKAIKINPVYPMAYYDRGLAFEAQKNVSQAFNSFTKAIELNPHYLEAYAKRSLLYRQSGDWPKAIADFTRVIELSPLNAESYNDRGVLYGERDYWDKAIVDFTKAIKLNPQYATAYYNRAGTFYQIKEYDKALADLQKAAALGFTVNPGFIHEVKRALGQAG